MVIRSSYNRKRHDSHEKLFKHFEQKETAGTYNLERKKDQKKRKPRLATMEGKYDKVKIARPSSLNKTDYPDEYIELYAIEARERAETIPEGEEGVLWRLLTTHKINSLSEAIEVVYWYSLRWRIEELFRTLKSKGLDVESSQNDPGAGLKKRVLI